MVWENSRHHKEFDSVCKLGFDEAVYKKIAEFLGIS